MAKVFGKRINNFLRLPSSKNYIILLKKRYIDVHNENITKKRDANTRNEHIVEILRVVQAWNPKLQWTRMHEKLALKFAARLSPEFELWVYDKIHELLTTGETKLGITPWETIIHSIRLIANQLEKKPHRNVKLFYFLCNCNLNIANQSYLPLKIAIFKKQGWQ